MSLQVLHCTQHVCIYGEEYLNVIMQYFILFPFVCSEFGNKITISYLCMF